MKRIFCRRRLRANGKPSACEHHAAGYGKVLSELPICPACRLRMERPALEHEQTLAVLETVVADPLGSGTSRIGWDFVDLVAAERGHRHMIRRIEGLRAEQVLGPAFPWAVQAERTGLIFTRRDAST